VGEWTWLHVWFPLADIELISDPLDAKAANVLVRTVRKVPVSGSDMERGFTSGEAVYEVRVAPHNVAPFRGGPWLRRFTQHELEHPGQAISDFRAFLCEEVRKAREMETNNR
jgi:hypothetical protein